MDMAAAVARHEHHILATQHAEQELVRRFAERRGDAPPLRLLQPGDIVHTAAAQDSQNRHCASPMVRWCIIPFAHWGMGEAREVVVKRPKTGQDVLEYEILGEQAATIGRLSRELRAALDALVDFDRQET